MESSSNQPTAESHESSLGISVKQETADSCSYQASFTSDKSQIKIEDGSKTSTSCEAMDTNNNNNAPANKDPTESKATENDTSPNKPDSATIRELRAKQVESARIRASMGLSQADFTSPEFRSRTETPVSSSQLLNIPSSALFALEGLDFNTPVGSGQITPLASARIGRKRQLSVSPQLSSSSIDLNSLIRTSPTSLVNYITNSRSSSAGSIGHLSPSFFSKPARLQTPLGRPLQLSLRNAGYPLPPGFSQSVDQSEKSDTSTTMQTDIKEEREDTEYQGDMSHHPPDIKMEHDMPPLIVGTGSQQFTTLETVREESVGAVYDSEDEGHPTSISDYPSADLESNGDSKSGIVDSKTKRVYYNYPSVEDPHNNQCKWADCTHQCDTLEALVQHVNNEHIYHDSRKEFVCYWNGCVREKKAFKAQYMLLVHMRRHTGEKPHKCTYEGCNKAYSRLENLKTHLRSHTGERPYVCKVEGCLKAFSNASDCAKHMNRTHTNEKPYACPNPGCTKRYTDPSSRRKHVKNCQVNKRVKTEDESMSGAEEDAPTEPKAQIKKTSKPRKSEKRKANVPSSVPPPNPFAAHAPPSGGGMSLTDHGYFSGGSQGYNSSQLSFNNSMPEADAEYPNLRAAPDEEISHILQQQRLSDPVDPVTMQSSIGLAMANQVGLSGANHVTDHMNPNVRASRQNGGGLTLPAGSIQPTPPHSHLHIHSSFPTSQSQSKYSQYHGLPQSNQLTSNTRTNRMTNQAPSQQHFTNGRRNQPTSNGHSMYRCYSPPKAGGMTGSRKSPSDDSSVISSSLRSSIITNSYSTFSSNSSRVSSPCSNSGRSDMMRPHPPISPRFNQTGFGFPSQTRADYPLKQNMKMNSSFPPRETYARRQNSDTWSERSWKSSQSSRYSFTGSELSDDLLENLPSSARRSNFTKVQPLPFPESMQSEFTMDCGTMTDQNGYMDMIPSQQIPNGDAPPFLSPDHLGQSKSDPLSTLPLHHFDSSNAMDVGNVNGFSTAHVGLFSQEAPNEEYDLIFNDLPYTASTSNMMVGEMSQFAGTLSEETQILEQMLRSRVK